MPRKWTPDSAIRVVKFSGQTVMLGDKIIKIRKQPGIYIWGAIDYLCHYQGFTLGRSEESPKPWIKKFVQKMLGRA